MIGEHAFYQRKINDLKKIVLINLNEYETTKLNNYISYYKIHYYENCHKIEYFIYYILATIFQAGSEKELKVICDFKSECYSLAINSIKCVLSDIYPHIQLKCCGQLLTINNF